jgi:leader peptidase (prepilin peptidase)/N-methyltransferase
VILRPESVFEAFAFLLGMMVGSFANVCVYRLPRDLAIARPRSRCIRCGSAIAWHDNIPLLGWLILAGRCRRCGSVFGVEHMAVELFVGWMAWWIFRTEGLSVQGVYLFVLSTSLLIVSAIDFEHRIIPDVISLNGIWIGILAAGLATWSGIDWFVDFHGACIGALAGGGLLWGVGTLYEKLTGREGIGFGDVKLLAMFGANAGVWGVLVSLFFGALFGSLIGIGLMVFQGKGSRTPIPFGPYLCFGLLIYAIGGGQLLFRFFPAPF